MKFFEPGDHALTSNFTEKIKESGISVIPVMAIVLILHYTIAPMDGAEKVPQFVVGGFLLILGLGIFLVGADIGMVPFGQRAGAALTYRKSLLLIMGAAFAIGFAVTIAEPDVQVLATQVNDVAPSINKRALLVMIATGVGFFLVVAMARIIFKLSLRMLLLIFYGLVFFACTLVEPAFVGVAFDAGGATTGPVTVPFIMALGIGVASTAKKKEGDDSSFGMVGLASIGPIAAVAMMGLFSSVSIGEGEATVVISEPESLVRHFLHLVPHMTREILFALLPIAVLFVLFQTTLLRLPGQQVKRILLGFVYTFIGLVLFMVGVSGGFSPAGRALGLALGAAGGGGWYLIPVGLLLGAVVVCAEPAVWVLNEQVETLSGGYIKRSIMLAALSISVALAVTLGMIRVTTGISIWWILVPGYLCALLMTRFSPPLFTAIAFDSGGVASGPMATTFILSLTLGASVALERNPITDAFGMVAMIAMAPLITIQILGLVFRYKEKQKKQMEAQK